MTSTKISQLYKRISKSLYFVLNGALFTVLENDLVRSTLPMRPLSELKSVLQNRTAAKRCDNPSGDYCGYSLKFAFQLRSVDPFERFNAVWMAAYW